MISRTEIVTRLLLSAIIGGFIGTEREVNNRPAGLRTHILVTLGSTLVMLVSIDGFQSADPSRLAAQVVSGIGFPWGGNYYEKQVIISVDLLLLPVYGYALELA